MLISVSSSSSPPGFSWRTPANKRWSEEVTHWQEGTSFEMRFQTEADHFPFPMDPMHGGWTLRPLSAQTTEVEVWWAFSTRPAWAAPLIIALMDRTLQRDIAAMVDSMVRAAQSPGAARAGSTGAHVFAPEDGHSVPS